MEVATNFLIDSDILIDFLRGVENAKKFFITTGAKARLIISAVNLVEVYSGKNVNDPVKREVIDEFLSGFEIINLDEEIAKSAGVLRANYQLPFADAIVAATAFSLDAVLITRNVKHFSAIDGLKLKKPY